jgi:hypothetical protein
VNSTSQCYHNHFLAEAGGGPDVAVVDLLDVAEGRAEHEAVGLACRSQEVHGYVSY